MKDSTTKVAVDLAKTVFRVAGEDHAGKVVFEKWLKSRDGFAAWLRSLSAGTVVLMETGPGAQAWARECQRLGLLPRILPAQRVKEHRSGSKNDRQAALALLRADRDTTIQPVPVKTADALGLQALHRVRRGYQKRRTAIGNQIRGLLLEHGTALARTDVAIERSLDRLLEDASVPLPDVLRELLADLQAEWRHLGDLIDRLTAKVEQMARSEPDSRRLMSIPGVGPITASAIACKSIDIERFASGRQFAAYFGIVPDQHGTGGKIRLGKMTRRGDGYIRGLALQGAHSVLKQVRSCADDIDSRRMQRWLKRHGQKGAAVRLANRNLRLIWALLRHGVWYEAGHCSSARQLAGELS